MTRTEIQLFLKLVELLTEETEEDSILYTATPVEVPILSLLIGRNLIDNKEWLTLTNKGKQYLNMLEGTPLPDSKTVYYDPRFKD